MGLVSLFCLQANETFEILPYLFNSESAREKVPVIDFGSDTAVDSADENINAFIVDDIKKKRKISRGHRLFSNKKTVIDLTELENGSIDSDMVKQVTLSLQKLCNKNPSYRKGFLMIDLTDGTTKIVEDCLVPNENKLSHGALDRTELQCTVDETESTNSKLVTDLERKILEEFEWEEEDFNADNVVDDVDGCEGIVEGVNSDARGRDGSGEGGDVGSVEKSGEVEGVNSDARGRDGSGEGGEVGSVEKSGEVEGVNSDARGRDGSGEGGDVGSVEKSGEVEGVNSDARGRDVSGEDLENSESAYNVCIIPSLVLRMSILNDFYFKPGSWFGQLEAVQEDYIRLTNITKNFCCINVLLQVFFRINVLRNLLLGISHLPYVVHDQESLEFIQKITNMYTAVKCVGEEPDFYIEAVNTCYASTFYSMALFQTPTRGNRSRTNAQRIAASVSRGGNHQDSNEILLSLVHILDNVYKYQNINFDIDSSLGYQLTSVVQPDIGINLSLKDIVLNYYLSERISFGIRPCSELFAILLLHKDCCSSCGKISLFCSTVEELVIDLPHYDSSSKVFKCEFKYAIRNHSFFIPDIISKNCSSCSPSNSIQHERAVRIVRAPSILVRLNI